MLITVEEFRARVANQCDDLISQLQQKTGRFGSEEAEAWKQSLPKLSSAFRSNAFQPFHLYFGGKGNIALEYQLPAAPSWCDVVLLGRHEGRASAVIVELKNWQTQTDSPGSYEGLMEHHGSLHLHPSDQVKGYVEYCSRFHSAIEEHNARVSGCVLFTADKIATAYGEPPNDHLTAAYPYFTTSTLDLGQRFPEFFSTRLTEPDTAFAEKFASGTYRQTRGFVAQVGQQILHPDSKAFELLDNQRTAFNLCEQTVSQAFLYGGATTSKKVVIVKGPPGSGKSAIAARLWASLVTNSDLPEGNVIFTSTSLSQYSNLEHLVEKTSKLSGSGGVVRKATGYSPITTQQIGAYRKKHGKKFLSDAIAWRHNLKKLQELGQEWRSGAQNDENLISIVDEAHALINPEHANGRGQFGFAPTLGPQAYHIIRSSRLTVFFLDPVQAFRERENTTLEDIRAWTMELCGTKAVEVSLDDVQFRCAGSIEYIEWIESVLGGASADENAMLAKRWSALLDSKGFAFDVYDNPESWEGELKQRVNEGRSVRLLATYSRPWVTKGISEPHDLPAKKMDFFEPYTADGKKKHWNRVWNYVPNNDYSWFVSAHPAGKIADDPLCEVGCTYAVRGFDFDYVGILWLNDLVWRNNKWQVNPATVHESGTANLARRARRKSTQGNHDAEELLGSVLQAYRILFTRAIRGVSVWIPDEGTRQHLMESLGQ